jgi:hypothetical protein
VCKNVHVCIFQNRPKEDPEAKDLELFGLWQTELYIPPPAVDVSILYITVAYCIIFLVNLYFNIYLLVCPAFYSSITPIVSDSNSCMNSFLKEFVSWNLYSWLNGSSSRKFQKIFLKSKEHCWFYWGCLLMIENMHRGELETLAGKLLYAIFFS